MQDTPRNESSLSEHEDDVHVGAAQLPKHTRQPTRRAKSIVVVNTGDGKGKTTAAMGIMLRSVARDWRVTVVQFVKSPKWNPGERKLAARLGVEWCTSGDGFTWDSPDLDKSAAQACHGWQLAAEKLVSGDYDTVVLDEITYPVSYGWIDVEDVVQGILGRAEKTNVVLTGRNAHPRLLEVADTVTRMENVKHAYQAGISAKKGIDF